ncbi:NmrA family NAD(P)-binding protein [Lysobacter soli]|uniref:NmrA family NAD(P)-binding protein n=1 Tax=Lysobacter soli TaxID=453783 RepID=UPI0037C8A34A
MSAILVTGATGTVGSAVVSHLLARQGVKVVAAVRPGSVYPGPTGVEVRPVEFGAHRRDLEAVLDGIDRLFLMRPPAIANVRDQLFPLIDAALARNIAQIVFLSLQGVQFNRSTPHHAVERYLRERRAPCTLLRPNFFMQNLSTIYADEIRRTDRIVVPAGRSRTAFIDARDVGRVAAATFVEPGHVGKAYTLSGEHSLSYRKVAQIMSRVLGREIVYARPSETEYLARLAARGASREYLDVQKMIYRIVRLNLSALPNRSVRKLTGTPAATFAQFASDYRDVWTR